MAVSFVSGIAYSSGFEDGDEQLREELIGVVQHPSGQGDL
jgi:hypothetical protein